jgi:hypothetical protein
MDAYRLWMAQTLGTCLPIAYPIAMVADPSSDWRPRPRVQQETGYPMQTVGEHELDERRRSFLMGVQAEQELAERRRQESCRPSSSKHLPSNALPKRRRLAALAPDVQAVLGLQQAPWPPKIAAEMRVELAPKAQSTTATGGTGRCHAMMLGNYCRGHRGLGRAEDAEGTEDSASTRRQLLISRTARTRRKRQSFISSARRWTRRTLSSTRRCCETCVNYTTWQEHAHRC